MDFNSSDFRTSLDSQDLASRQIFNLTECSRLNT